MGSKVGLWTPFVRSTLYVCSLCSIFLQIHQYCSRRFPIYSSIQRLLSEGCEFEIPFCHFSGKLFRTGTLDTAYFSKIQIKKRYRHGVFIEWSIHSSQPYAFSVIELYFFEVLFDFIQERFRISMPSPDPRPYPLNPKPKSLLTYPNISRSYEIYQEVAVRIETCGASFEGYLRFPTGTAHDRASIDPQRIEF
jgi:hypothetical protein